MNRMTTVTQHGDGRVTSVTIEFRQLMKIKRSSDKKEAINCIIKMKFINKQVSEASEDF